MKTGLSSALLLCNGNFILNSDFHTLFSVTAIIVFCDVYESIHSGEFN
jgi:hypothetical protein